MIAACVKWVEGISSSDAAAVELALQHAAAVRQELLVLTVGPPAADRALRDALACGATRVLRIDAPTSLPSHAVASLLAAELTDATTVWCGDCSSDRGTGSVPAFLAAVLHAAQALGVVEVTIASDGVRATRRLDGGRREQLFLAASAAAVLSVEGAAARLRRAALPALLEADRARIDVRAGGRHAVEPEATVRPYRPRPRALPAPHGGTLERIREITDVGGRPAHGETVALEPPAAAVRIVAALRDWGYLEHR